MKFIIALLLLTQLTAQAQQNNNLKRVSIAELVKTGNSNNVYVYNDNLTKFVGTWVGKEGGRTVQIVFVKKAFRLSKDPSNISEIELITGTFQYFKNGNLIKTYTNDDMSASLHNKDTLNVFIDIHERKTQVALLASFLQGNKIKLQVEKNRFEYKNDKDFILQDAIILTRQN